MSMIFSQGFNDTALRFEKINHHKRAYDLQMVGDVVIGGDELVVDGDAVLVSDSILFDGTDFRPLVTGCIKSFANVDGVVGFLNYDTKTRELLVVGDYLGRVPLYYYRQKNLFGNKVLIASELKCFFGLPLKDVKLLGMGEYITMRDGMFYVGSYSTISRELIADDGTDESVLTSIRNLLTSAVAKIVNNTNGMCVFLSGGVDSTVCAALAKKFKPDITAYTFSVGDKGKADLYYARRAAAELDIPLTEVIVTQEQVLADLNEIIYFNEDSNWTQITSAVGQYYLAKAAAKDGFITALCGDLSDEIFASYPQIERWSWRDEQYVDARTKLINKAWINPNRSVKVMLNAGGISYVDPFSDREFLEFASNVPPRFKDGKLQGKRVNKWLLRSAFNDLIPTEIATRAKGCQGAVSFVDEIFNSPEGKKLIKDTYESMFNHDGKIVNVVKR